MTFVPLTEAETDAKSPMDDALWEKVRENFDDLDSRITAAGSSPVVMGVLGRLMPLKAHKRIVDYSHVQDSFQPSLLHWSLRKSGTTGIIEFDIRKHTRPNTYITGIDHQYSAATQSVGNIAPAHATQSIARTTAQINTQSISHAKAALNVQSIIGLGGNLWQYNLDSAPDADYSVGDSITFAGCTSGGNNVTAAIIEVSRSGGANVVVSNATGVAQTGAAGTAQLKIMSYNYTNPVSSEFVATESVVMASHTTGANNGTFTIYKINQSGNNIWVKNASGATQAGVAGTADNSRWRFTFLGAPSVTDFIVTEKAKMASHSNANNNGNFTIVAVNALSIDVHNAAGVAQAGAAGTVNTNRWTYAMPTNPSSQVSAGHTVYFSGHTSSANDGVFTVKEVNRSGGNNLVVYNESGVTQGGVAGTTEHTKKLVKFASDMSATYTTASFIEMWGVVSGFYNQAPGRAPFQVLEVNRGGGANFNVVIDNQRAPSQASPAGFVVVEMRSILTSKVTITASKTGNVGNDNLTGTSTDFVASAIATNAPIGLYFTQFTMLGDPRFLTVRFK